MAHFAKLDENNVVTDILVVNNNELDSNDEETSGIDFLNNLFGIKQKWKQTSYNGNFRKQYAGIGYTYDAVNDVFIAPQPFASWSLDTNFDWQPPISQPEGLWWKWDEQTLSWIDGTER